MEIPEFDLWFIVVIVALAFLRHAKLVNPFRQGWRFLAGALILAAMALFSFWVAADPDFRQPCLGDFLPLFWPVFSFPVVLQGARLSQVRNDKISLRMALASVVSMTLSVLLFCKLGVHWVLSSVPAVLAGGLALVVFIKAFRHLDRIGKILSVLILGFMAVLLLRLLVWG
jgi:hypothetical protein